MSRSVRGNRIRYRDRDEKREFHGRARAFVRDHLSEDSEPLVRQRHGYDGEFNIGCEAIRAEE